MKVKWDEMLPYEFEAARIGFPVCFLPLGTLERHGTHLPFGLDGIKAHELCLRVAKEYGGVVAPPLHWGTHGFWSEDFKRSATIKQPPGSVYISEGVLFNLLLEMFREIAYSGFKVLVVLTGHYPVCQVGIIKRAAEQFMAESKMKVWALAEIELSGEVIIEPNHAGKGETAFMLELRPELVDMTKAPPLESESFVYCSKDLHEATIGLGKSLTDYVVKSIGEECLKLLTGIND